MQQFLVEIAPLKTDNCFFRRSVSGEINYLLKFNLSFLSLDWLLHLAIYFINYLAFSYYQIPVKLAHAKSRL